MKRDAILNQILKIQFCNFIGRKLLKFSLSGPYIHRESRGFSLQKLGKKYRGVAKILQKIDGVAKNCMESQGVAKNAWSRRESQKNAWSRRESEKMHGVSKNLWSLKELRGMRNTSLWLLFNINTKLQCMRCSSPKPNLRVININSVAHLHNRICVVFAISR